MWKLALVSVVVLGTILLLVLFGVLVRANGVQWRDPQLSCKDRILAFVGLKESTNWARKVFTFPKSSSSAIWLKKISIMLVMGAVAVVFSKDFVPKWIGLKWAASDALCTGSEAKQAQFYTEFKARINYDASLVQTNTTASKVVNLHHDVTDAFATPASPSGSPVPFPDACTSASYALQQANLNRKCNTEVCQSICGHPWWALGFEVCSGPYCKTVEVPCGYVDPDQQQADADYQNSLRLHSSHHETSHNYTVPPSDNEEASKLLNRLLYQADVAGTVYIVYCAISLLFSSPAQLYRSKLSVRITRMSCQIPKLPFIVAFIFIWWTSDYLRLAFHNLHFQSFFRNFWADPCFVTPRFTFERYQFMTQSCANLSMAESQYTAAMEDYKSFKDSFQYCNKTCVNFHHDGASEPGWCPGFHSLHSRYLSDMNYLLNTPYAGHAACTDIDYGEYLVPSHSSHVAVSYWFTSGVPAQMAIKVVLSNAIQAAALYADPLIFFHAQYEADHELSAADESNKRLTIIGIYRTSNLLPLIFWCSLTLMALVSMLYAAWQLDRANEAKLDGTSIAIIAGFSSAMTLIVTCSIVYLWLSRKKESWLSRALSWMPSVFPWRRRRATCGCKLSLSSCGSSCCRKKSSPLEIPASTLSTY